MRTTPKPEPLITDHRLTRFLTLVWLRLLRMAGRLMFGVAPFKDELNAFSRFVAAFVLIRAVRLADSPRRAPPRRTRRPANAPHGFRRRRARKSFAFVRIAVGAKLWRALRGRSAFAHISALIRAILDRDSLAARLAQRLKRGLSRLSPLVLTHAFADALTGAPFAPPYADDSS